jgi:uncharacterized SAM-binding protein YcdF (DUF218 family)
MKIYFLKKKECTAPTLLGWLAICSAVILASGSMMMNCNAFLTVSKPIDTRVMVVEGWLPEYALAQAAKEFRSGRYSLLFSTGIRMDKGDYFWKEKTWADMGASSMRRLGLDSASVIAVPASAIKVDRTYASACALRRWIDSSDQSISNFNLVSLGPHSRRSRLLFRKALGEKVEVGVISFSDETYDPNKWWKTSNGFKATIDEAISYCYTKLVFSLRHHGDLL